MKKILIFGAGEGSQEILRVIIEDINKLHSTWEVLGYIDPDKSLKGKVIAGYKVLGARYKGDPSGIYGTCGLIDNSTRAKIIEEEIKKAGFQPASLVHPSVICSSDFKHGEGLVMFPSVRISYNVEIGNNVIVNYNSILGHDLRIGDNSFIGPSVTITGGNYIGSNCTIGAGSVFLPGRKVDNNAVVGAGTIVLTNVEMDTMVMDMPRKIERSKSN